MTAIDGQRSGLNARLGRRDGPQGGVPADRVLNAMALPEITRYLRQKRRSLARAS
ncbi:MULTISPECIES: hypothetical protein [Bradyrhizobium]|uniref:hypothetical protein n=1 Tax=Bradyrhizobium TaxID=374 RepID=UPI00042A6A57|nr:MULTISPECIES: hypothetical protein [Bradyrhizobium]UFW54102.1 hypothetical protein BaraCB756_40565 [Bradyrhizobium arachidis]